MKYFPKIICVFCLCCVLFSACAPKEIPHPLCRVVTEIDIVCDHPKAQIRRHYTSSQKMQYVLIYLRLLDPKNTTAYPPATEEVYHIQILFSDGSHRTYRQTAHRYLSRDNEPWKSIDPGSASGLYSLMRKLPSDPDNLSNPAYPAAIFIPYYKINLNFLQNAQD